MEKVVVQAPSNKGGEKQLFNEVYTQTDIDTFWKSTDDDTTSKVRTAAQCEKEDLLPQKIRKRLSSREKKYIDGSSAPELETILQSYLDQATERQDNVKNSTRKTLRAEKSATKFLNIFHGYVQAYSGVVQIMNAAGPGYGDAAYGALSTFLVVAVNKAKTEELIESMLVSLQHQYCRIQMVKEVYATARMKELTAVVYRVGIEFLYEAVRYYSTGTFRRFWHGLSSPPSVYLAVKVSEIEASIEEIRKEMEVLDGIRLNKIEHDIARVGADVQLVKKDVQALRDTEDNNRLETIQALLQLDRNSVDISLQEYANDLSQKFEGHRGLPPFDADACLFSNRRFNQWRKSEQASLMILHGATVAPNQTILSWISPGAVALVSNFEELFQSARPILLRHFCQVDDSWDARPNKVSPSTVLASFIFQILRSEKGKPLLREENTYAELRDNLETFAAIQRTRATDRVEKLYSILRSILTKSKLRNVLIVVDRVDRIEGDLYRFLDPLMSLLKQTDCTLKVFMTLRAPYAFEDGHIKDTLGGRYTSLSIDQDG